MGYLDIKMTLNKGRQPDLASTEATFAQMIEMIGVHVVSAKVDSISDAVRVRAEGVTGLVDTPISISYLTAEGMLRMVSQHPDGPDAAEKVARTLAERLTTFNLTLGRVIKSKHKWNNRHEIIWAVEGWRGSFRSVFIDYKPQISGS